MEEFQSRGNHHIRSKTTVRRDTIEVLSIAEAENNIDLSKSKEEGGVIFKLDYQLISSLTYSADSETYETVYSLLVSKTTECGTAESELLFDVSRDEGRAVEFYDIMLRNTVMPVTLREISEDLLPA